MPSLISAKNPLPIYASSAGVTTTAVVARQPGGGAVTATPAPPAGKVQGTPGTSSTSTTALTRGAKAKGGTIQRGKTVSMPLALGAIVAVIVLLRAK